MIRDCGHFINFCETRAILKRVIYNLGNLIGSNPKEGERKKKEAKTCSTLPVTSGNKSRFLISKSEQEYLNVNTKMVYYQ